MTGLAVRFNPLVLLLAGLAALAGSMAVRTLTVAVLACALWGVVAVMTVPSWRYMLLCLGFASLAALSVAYSTWRMGGHDVQIAAVAGLRIIVLAWPGTVAAGMVDTARLGDYLAQSLRLPARFVVAFIAALQRFAALRHTWSELVAARRARGMGPEGGPVAKSKYAGSMAFGLLTSALRGTTTSTIAMDAREFRRAGQRTWLEPAVWSRLDRHGAVAVLSLGLWPVAYQLVMLAA